MANLYVYSGGSNTSPYDTWAKAATTLSTAASATAAGDTVYVAHDHAQSTAGTVSISLAARCRVLCVNRAGSVPPVAADLTTGATVTTTGNNSINIDGIAYWYGIGFVAGSGASGSVQINPGGYAMTFEACAFKLGSTGNSWFNPASESRLRLRNCTLEFGGTGQAMTRAGELVWENKAGSAALLGAVAPTSLVQGNSVGRPWTFSGLDLSLMGSGKTIHNAISYAGFKLRNCKLNASVTIAAAPSGHEYAGVDLIGCHSTSNAARSERYRYVGTLTTETTIKRTAGASDGTTAYCWKVVTTANASRDRPFDSFEAELWNSATGSSKTLTVHVVTDNVTLKDDEIWIEAEYLGDSGYPVATLITDANATVLTTGANQTSDSGEAWTTTGLGTPVKQKLEVTFTPQMAGPVRWRVCVGKASATVYVCPKAELT